jgi:hypothetical protein
VTYLFDASSILGAIARKRVEVLVGEYPQILAVYEVLNAIWKYVYLLGKVTDEEAEGLVAVVAVVAKRMKMVNAVSRESEVLRVAVLTAYTHRMWWLRDKWAQYWLPRMGS